MRNFVRQTAVCLGILAGLWNAGCGGGGGGGTTGPTQSTPTVTVKPASTSMMVTSSLAVTVTVSGNGSTPTGTVTLSSGSYASSATTLSSGSASITIPASTLSTGTDTLTASYTPDSSSSSSYSSASGTGSVVVGQITVTPATATIGTQQQFTATVSGLSSSTVTWTVAAPSGVTLSAGTISSAGLYNTPYPAPATVTVTATSSSYTTISGSVTVTLSAPSTATGPALTVDVNTPNTPSENPHTINPYVYGVNGYLLDKTSEKTANPGIIRWGGDATTRYNYQTNVTNSASDWYFINYQGEGGMFPNATTSSDMPTFFQAVDNAGSAALGTVPVIGWVANSTQYACSFPKSTFPNQASYESDHNCGNGTYANGVNGCTTSGGCSIYGNDTVAAVTSIKEAPPSITDSTTPAAGSPSSTMAAWANATWSGGWVNSIVTNYGNGASGKGVAMWDLDNEPSWWDAVHRDVHPVAFTYDEVSNNGIGTALAIKTADPTALVSGPVLDFWWSYFYSKKDIESGWGTGPCYVPWYNPIDRKAHNGTPLIEYYLQQFKNYSTTYGIRLLDYLDIHAYFAPSYNGSSVAFTTAGDTQVQKARMNGTRVYWDSTYTDSNYPQPNYITDSNYTSSCSPPAQAPQVIPMMLKWVAADYPGTKTGIDEYNFGGLESINGAVTQADILGIFGREGLDMGAFWPTTNYSTQGPGNYAFGMYRNYDGNDSKFGEIYLHATSQTSGTDEQGQLAVYASQRSSDSAITIMAINKTYGPLTSTISLENFTAASGTTAAVYQYSNDNLTAIVKEAGVSVTPPTSGTTSTISNYTFPAQSITLFVVPN